MLGVKCYKILGVCNGCKTGFRIWKVGYKVETKVLGYFVCSEQDPRMIVLQILTSFK